MCMCVVSTADPDEKSRLQVALSASKNILNHVNHAVRECENRQRLADLQRRLDTRPLENSTESVIAQYKVSTAHSVYALSVAFCNMCNVEKDKDEGSTVYRIIGADVHLPVFESISSKTHKVCDAWTLEC